MHDAIVLIWMGFIFFAAVFFVCAAIVYLLQNKKIRFDKGLLFSLSACAVSIMLCLSIWPPVHRVYDDEFTYISQSTNLLNYGKADILLKGSLLHPEVSASWAAHSRLPGFAWLEAATLFLTGNFEHSYFILNIVLGALSVVIAYRISWLWTASHIVAWWSAIFLACLPARIVYSMSAASDIAGLFFFLLFLLFISEYRIQQIRLILYAAFFSGVYSICIRPPYIIFVIPGIAAALVVNRWGGWLGRKLCLQIVLDAICLFLPVLIAIPFMFISDFIKAGLYAPSFVVENFYISIAYLFKYEQGTLLTALAASVAVLRNIFYKSDNMVTGLAGWFLIGLLTISALYAGGISYPGSAYSDRYILSFSFPFVLLAAKGVTDVTRMAKSRLLTRLLMGLFFTALVANASFASQRLDVLAKDGAYYKKTLLLKNMAHVIPNDAYLIEECAALGAAETSMKSIQTTTFLGGGSSREGCFPEGNI